MVGRARSAGGRAKCPKFMVERAGCSRSEMFVGLALLGPCMSCMPKSQASHENRFQKINRRGGTRPICSGGGCPHEVLEPYILAAPTFPNCGNKQKSLNLLWLQDSRRRHWWPESLGGAPLGARTPKKERSVRSLGLLSVASCSRQTPFVQSRHYSMSVLLKPAPPHSKRHVFPRTLDDTLLFTSTTLSFFFFTVKRPPSTPRL